MKEIYAWVPWFTELARKIAQGGEHYLIEAATRVEWRDDGGKQPLLKHGDDNIDPFSFIYSVAARSKESSVRMRVFPSIENVFAMNNRMSDFEDYAYTFPIPQARAWAFHDGARFHPTLLWQLFIGAVQGFGSVSARNFADALDIRNVATKKLTQALFLINPAEFIPIDDDTASLGLFPYEKVPPRLTLTEYGELIHGVRGAFPDCELFEINMFAYLRNRGKLTLDVNGWYQVSTMAHGEDGDDHWDNFKDDNCVYTGGAGSDKKRYPLDEPEPGNIILVRCGQHEGRGIGVVYRNDYYDGWTQGGRLHVLWLNKATSALTGSTPRDGFSRAWNATQRAFGGADAYQPTFDLVERLNKQEGVPSASSLGDPSVNHPRNRILYGPPGTGKTWIAVNHALAIIDGKEVRSDVDRERFHSLRFDLKSGEGQIAMVTFHQSFAYEDFIEGIRPSVEGKKVAYKLNHGIFKRIAKRANDSAEAGGEERFVLVIDEINRGNIAKIFGELITLIEDSRRLGQDDATEVTLPYSGETFGVPDNLYIIGTMNTADRSIQLLDTALRRRFTFMEMMPEPRHRKIETDIEGVNCRDLLTAINKRVAALLDREHQIGHTYLFNVTSMEELSFTFRNKIFPLLQEYFFDDWLKIRAVLGNNAFVQAREPEPLLLNANLVDDEHKTYERLSDKDQRWLDPREYRRIYRHARTDETNSTEPGS